MQRRSNRKSRKRKLRPYVWVVIGLFLFMFLSAGASLGYTKHLLADTPEWNPEILLKTNETSIIYNFDGSIQLTKLHGAENRTTVDIETVPKLVKDAFLATEDVRFYEHHGIDFRALARAVYSNLTNGFGSEGASTITQQVVKGAFLNPEKTIKRKVQEVYLSLQLERNYTKNEIFEMYLNRIYFGHGAYGIQAAAQLYFNKSVDKLDLPEAAMLAGLPQRPNGYSPFNNKQLAAERRAKVIRNMERYGMITPEDAEKALQDQFRSLNTNRLAKADGSGAVDYPHPYFVEHVIETLIDSYGAQKVFNGGLRVYTTIDLDIQKAAEDAINNNKNFPKSVPDESGNKQPQGAAVVLDPKTGYIKAIVGGRGSSHTEQRILNRATQSKRQTGSTFKPLLAYAPAIDSKGIGAASVIDDYPVDFGNYQPSNLGANRGPTTVREALRRSVNVVAVKAMKMTGVKTSLDYAQKMGLSLDKNDAGLGLALGGLTYGITPLELTAAYGTLANEGVYTEPTAIIRVEDKNGKILYEHNSKKTKVFKESTSYIVTDMLITAVKSGTGTNARFGGWPIAGKTGTTNDNKDIWFAGYTPELTAVVWVGHDQPKAMPSSYGGTYPAYIWREIMQKAHKEKKITSFPKAKGIEWATVCKISGDKPSELCPEDHLVTDIFPSGSAPTEVCDIHIEVEVCTESNQIPTEFCPITEIEKRVLIKKDTTKVKIDGLEPEEKCTLHTPENSVPQPNPTDPVNPSEPTIPANSDTQPAWETAPNKESRVNLNNGAKGSKTYYR